MYSRFKPNDWIIDSDLNIGVVIKSSDYYLEEFCSEKPTKKLKYGDYLTTLVYYKILCDSRGKIRKRQRFKYCNQVLCHSASADKYMNIIKSIELEESAFFSKFEKEQPKKEIDNTSPFYVYIDEESVGAFKAYVDDFLFDEKMGFFYDDLVDYMLLFRKGLTKSYLKSAYDRSHNILVVWMYNRGLKVQNQKTLFSDFATGIRFPR